MTMLTPQKNKGYTLLFSVLISSLLLAIGLAILTISKKELLLSSAGRESQFAFYAADTGSECALYWDLGAGRGVFDVASSISTISCNGQTAIPVTKLPNIVQGSPLPGVTRIDRFTFDMSLDPAARASEPCASVIVDKRYSGPGVLNKTIVRSQGHNTCDTTDPRRVERALKVTY